MRKHTVPPLAALFFVSACHRHTAPPPVSVTPAPPPPAARTPAGITSADLLLAAMHDRYAGKWYRNVTFIQKSTTIRPDGTPARVETWYEALQLPGLLRIDLGEPSRAEGVLYRGDSVYTVQGGRISDRRIGRNPLLILGFDVYAQPVARTMQQLSAEHQTNPERRITRDIRFAKYVPRDGGWLAEDVQMFSGGRMVFREEYSDVRVNAPLDENLFVPEQWTTATHWYKP